MKLDHDAQDLAAASRVRERVVLLTLAAVQFTSIVDFTVIMPLGPQLMRTLHINPAQFGLVVSSYTLAAGIAGLVASSLIDRFGRKSAFLSLYSGFLIGTLLCGLAPTYHALVAARLATGAFGGILGGMALAIIGDVFPEVRRGRATGALMSAFALALVAGVPLGLYLGTKFGWHATFLVLAGVGCPMLVLGTLALPPLRDHVGQSPAVPPLRLLVDTFSRANHLNAFALIVALMFGAFAVIPYVSPYLVSNVGLTEHDLTLPYIVGGVLTLIAAPLVGRVADKYGKLRVYRVIAPVSAVMMLIVTHLPQVGLRLAVAAVSALMVSNAGRMVAAMAMVTSSVESRRRGGFMSANSSVQHLSSGLGAFVGGHLLVVGADHRLENFGLVGWIGVATTLLSLWLAGRLRSASAAAGDLPETPAMSTAQCVAAAAEGVADSGDPIARIQ